MILLALQSLIPPAAIAADTSASDANPAVITNEEFGSASGRVSGLNGVPREGTQVVLHEFSPNGVPGPDVATAFTGADGSYLFTDVQPGTYSVQFWDGGAGYVTVWLGGSQYWVEAVTFTIAAGSTTSGLDVELPLGGRVVGTIKGTGSDDYFPADYVPSARAWVQQLQADGKYLGQGNAYAGQYDFEIGALPPGTYRAYFTGSGYLTEWWQDAEEETATTFEVRAGETTTLDAVLTAASKIEGRIQDEHGNDLRNASAVAYEKVDGRWIPRASGTASLGGFTIGGLHAGQYAVAFHPNSTVGYVRNYRSEWWDDQPDADSATLVTVGESGLVRLEAAKLADAEPTLQAAEIHGIPVVGEQLRAIPVDSAPATVVRGVQWLADGQPIPGATGPSLELTEDLLGARVSVSRTAWVDGYPEVTRTSEPTDPVALGSPTITRIAGADRYETSALISRSQFQPGVPIAYIASGENFPDALAGAPVAGVTGGPMLLTAPYALPESIRAELERLQPQRIVVLGGTATISSSVEAQLDTIRPGAVSRLAGPDRYSTSVAISASQFEPGVPVVFIASGAKFPDALAGAPVAGITGGPMLLTDPNGLPDSVTAELERLQPKRIVILGGTSTVSDAVEARLQDLQPGAVTRLSGSDRYETSALISASQFQPGVPVVFIASGAKFPDALAGAPVAGITGGPMLLADPNGLPDSVTAELERLQPKRIVILGGTSTVSDAVEARLDALW